MTTLTEDEMRTALALLPGWSRDGDAISRQFTFPTFPAGIAFVDRVAQVAEQIGHHPDISINYNVVALRLSTHEAGGVTEKDVDLARRLDQLAELGA